MSFGAGYRQTDTGGKEDYTMKAVAILGGLGSQMFKYAFYLQLSSKETCYIDTMPFKMDHMWNGYELDRIFGIEAPDLADYMEQKELDEYLQKGLNYKNAGVRVMEKLQPGKKIVSVFRGYLYPQRKTPILYFLSLVYNKIKRGVYRHNDVKDVLPVICKTDIFSFYYDEINHTSDRYIGGAEGRAALREIFKFPLFTDAQNQKIAKDMENCNSVAIHVRRSDHMYDNGNLFESGYFPKAIQYIKDTTTEPVFYIFSDEPQWCRENLNELGFVQDDDVRFVDWNRKEESFRDMQLMTHCKDNVLVISSFSWWGYYLSGREDKVVCAPKGCWFEVPVHF